MTWHPSALGYRSYHTITTWQNQEVTHKWCHILSGSSIFLFIFTGQEHFQLAITGRRVSLLVTLLLKRCPRAGCHFFSSGILSYTHLVWWTNWSPLSFIYWLLPNKTCSDPNHIGLKSHSWTWDTASQTACGLLLGEASTLRKKGNKMFGVVCGRRNTLKEFLCLLNWLGLDYWIDTSGIVLTIQLKLDLAENFDFTV